MGSDCEEKCPHAQEVAETAVKKVFAILGVDINKPESVEEFREDLRFGKKMRKAADHGFLAMVTIFSGAILIVLWAGVTAKFKGGV